jgi:hypothetical protein
MLAVRGRISGRARVAALLAAAGELAMDKTPAATNRTATPAVIGRIVAGAYTGRAVAGNAGIAAGSGAAAVGTYATFRARKLAVEWTGLPDPVLALGEDAVALAAAALATRSEPRDDSAGPEVAEPPQRSIIRDGARGVVIGAIATATMTLAQGAEFALTDSTPSDAPVTVAEKVKRGLGAGRIKRRHKPALNQAMHWAYGASWGVPYGVAAGRLPVAPEISGPAFGLLVWGAGLAIQPVAGIAEPPWKRSATSLGSEAILHLVYGIGAAAAQRSLPR